MIQVPEEFRPHQLKPYPPDNFEPFEEWFGKNYDPARNKSDREYLPIYWTSFYCNNHHGKHRRSMRHLQDFLDRLDRTKKYWTIVQYDDWILNNVSHLDLKVFGMGCKGDYQLPLVCQPHHYEFKENGRPIFASFIGAVTHPIRQKMIDELKDKEDYFISTERTSLHTYCKIMSMSKFALCPRGYGKTSFRIQEALQYGAIPIYISDEHLSPGNKEQCFCVNTVEEAVYYMGRHIKTGEKYPIEDVYKEFYTYEAVANMIYENI